ncbi:MAG: S41 family peptidase [Acidobacteria bacterium]|nr:MAG: S41 family peptidase [Acidobacteriota bacterium]
MKDNRRFPTLPALLLLALVPAAVIGARSTGAPSPMATYAEILSIIESRHVPEAPARDVIYSSIDGMLATLDPHTNFLDDEVYREMREEQRGQFYGLGIVISKRGKYEPLRVVAPIDDTPAARLGIRAGDVITHIRDERAGVDVDTLGLTIQESVKYLRGPRGTTVEITIDRAGLAEPLVLRIVRDAVRTPAVNQAYEIAPGVAYVKIANFAETTMAELDRALERLGDQGAHALLLDLRNNPGGLLDQAVGVSSRFLQPGELVVYTEGRQPGSRQDYEALDNVPRIDWPVVVLVDRGSASASEIVAGALQDHDRALIVGQTTFGKGLVQSVYPLSEGTGLALTTQKYYTPAGRSIQRPYDSEERYYYQDVDDEPQGPPENAPPYRTDLGRTVFGGGGIAPDVVVAPERAPEVLVRLRGESAFSRFVDPRSESERAAWEQDPDALFAAFRAFVAREFPDVDQAALEAARGQALDLLLAEIALTRGGLAARDRVLLERDPVVRRALEALPDAKSLLARRKVLRENRAALRQR